jgi:methionine--tRNA ligase beta chain
MNPDIQAYCTTLRDLVGVEDPIAILERTPSVLRSLITGVDPQALVRRPRPGKWSIAEIVAHLTDSELVFGYRLRTIFAVNGARLQAFDPDRWASTFDYESCEAHSSAEMFAALRSGTLRMLRRVPASLMDNTGIHEEWGSETARSVIRLEAGHDKNHLAQIQRILDGIGASSGFKASQQKAEVPLDLAEKVDLRIGTITDIVALADADRLMKLTVDFGNATRSVIAGIREERSDPRALIGQQALFYFNLPPRKIRGHLSEAMLCDVGYADGIVPALLQPERPVPDGTRAG